MPGNADFLAFILQRIKLVRLSVMLFGEEIQALELSVNISHALLNVLLNGIVVRALPQVA